MAGGVHGKQSIGRNVLLECVGFRRVAGVACAKYTLCDKLIATSLLELSGGGLAGNLESFKLAERVM